MAVIDKTTGRRVIVVHWKNRKENAFEVFSNLKVFCGSYPAYSYNTLNNYLSKERTAFVSDLVHIERKGLINRPVDRPVPETVPFKMVRAVRTGHMKDIDQGTEDFAYWLSRSSRERLAAATFLVFQSLQPEQRMDKSVLVKRKM